MASYLWSNPDPSNATSAALSAGYKVDAANIGPIVAAIMEDKRRQQALEQAQYNDMLKSVSGAASSISGAYMQNRQQDINDDTARAAMYFNQNPQSYQDYIESGQIPAGITEHGNLNDATLLKAMSELTNDRIMNEYRQKLTGKVGATGTGKIWNDQAQGYVTPYRNAMLNRAIQQNVGGSRPTSAAMMHEQRIADQQRMAADLGVTPQDLDAAMKSLYEYVPGKTAFPKFGLYQEEPSGEEKQRLVDAAKQYRESRRPASPKVNQADQQPKDTTASGSPDAKQFEIDARAANEAIQKGAPREQVIARLRAAYPNADLSGL